MQVKANNAPARKKMRKIQEYGYITNKHEIGKIRQIERGGGGTHNYVLVASNRIISNVQVNSTYAY